MWYFLAFLAGFLYSTILFLYVKPNKKTEAGNAETDEEINELFKEDDKSFSERISEIHICRN